MNPIVKVVLLAVPLFFCSMQGVPMKKGWLVLEGQPDTLFIQKAEYGWNFFGIGKLKVTDLQGKKHTFRPKEVSNYYFKDQHFIFIPFYGDGTKNRDLVLMESLIYAPSGISYYQSFGLFEGIPNDYIYTSSYAGFVNEPEIANQLKKQLESCRKYTGETDPLRMEREKLKTNIESFNKVCSSSDK